MELFFFTIHNEAGDRIDDDSDYPLTKEQLALQLADMDAIMIGGEQFYKFNSADGAVIVQVRNLA